MTIEEKSFQQLKSFQQEEEEELLLRLICTKEHVTSICEKGTLM